MHGGCVDFQLPRENCAASKMGSWSSSSFFTGSLPSSIWDFGLCDKVDVFYSGVILFNGHIPSRIKIPQEHSSCFPCCQGLNFDMVLSHCPQTYGAFLGNTVGVLGTGPYHQDIVSPDHYISIKRWQTPWFYGWTAVHRAKVMVVIKPLSKLIPKLILEFHLNHALLIFLFSCPKLYSMPGEN